MTTDEVLNKYKKIAVLGFSTNPSRPSNSIAIFMKNAGYAVYGVNPGLAGREIEGVKCYATLTDVPDEVEIVNVFRNAMYMPEIVDEILKLSYKPKVIWTQLDVIHDEARERAVKAGIDYIENKCIYVEYKLNPNVKK